MKIIEEKNRVMKETFREWRRISVNPELVSEQWQREKAERDYNSRMEEDLEGRYLQGREEGIEKGMEKGRVEGIEKGRVEGKAEGIAEGIERAVRALYSHRMSREEIARNLGLPLEQVERYLSR